MTATAGALTAATLSTSDQKVGSTNTLTVNITTTNPVTSGGTIEVEMPKWNPNASTSDILSMIQGSYTCTAITNLESTITCSFSDTTDILIVSNAFNTANLAAGTNIVFSTTGFRNPISTALKDGFTVRTKAGDGGDVDTISASVQVTTAADITTGTISSIDTRIVQNFTTMRLVFPSPVPLDAGCLFYITFPTDLELTTTNLTQVRGVGLFGPSKNLTFSINTTNNQLTFTDGCSTYISPSFDATIDFTSISNPISTKPTDSISILITDSSGNNIASISSNIQYVATFGEINTTTLSATPTTVSSTSNLAVTILPNHKVTTDGALKITFPSAISFPSTTCTLSNHVAISTSAVCTISGQILRISSPFDTDYIPSSSGTIGFTVSSITMPSTTASTGSYIFQSVLVNSTIDYVIDKTTYTNLITASAGTLNTVTITPTSTVANNVTTYTIEFVNTHEIIQNGQILVQFPSEVTMSNPTQSANQCTNVQNVDSTFA